MFKFLEKPLVPRGVGPVYLQQKRKFTLPGSKNFINRKEKKGFFFLQHVQFNVAYVNTLLFILLPLTNTELLSLTKEQANEMIKR